jgi:hypothetical protein
MNKLVTILTLAMLAANTLTVKADDMQAKALDTTKRDNKVIVVTPPVWLAKVKTPDCNTSPLFAAPTLESYMDGDTDPSTAYADYVEDFRWWVEQNNMCGAF